MTSITIIHSGQGETMYFLLLIGLGGFAAAVLRYLTCGLIQNTFISFPLGTLRINFSEYRGFFTEETRIFLTIGLLGAFTTMSTFGYESFKLFEQEEMLLFGMNLFGTIMLVFFGVYLGKFVVVKNPGHRPGHIKI